MLRLLFVLHYRVDSDEPQHLHVVWGWTHGLMQYRDVFDNHTPLFHLACIPLLRLIGERPDALVFMRLAMVPLFFFSLWCVYRLGIAIKSREVGLWAAIFAALSPAFCFTFTEFRTDDLWTVFWLWSLVVLLGGAPTWRRGLIGGLLLGATVATSLKTLALLGCLGVAAVSGLALCGMFRATITDRRTYAFLGAALAGFVVIPGLLAAWFASQHALGDALYGIFTYNSVPGLGRIRILRDFVIGVAELIALIAVFIPCSGWLARRLIAPERQFRFHLIFLGSGFYGGLIYTLWPLLDAEHLIPFHPLLVLGWTPLLLDLLARPTWLQRPMLRPALLALAAIAIGFHESSYARTNALRREIEHYAHMLRLTNPSDYVMDLKGETIFRRRPYRYLFEGVGIIRAKQHLMPDTVVQDMIATKTCVAVHHNYRFSFPSALDFMEKNFLPIESYSVLGHAMTPIPETPAFTFHVVIPETFAFTAREKIVSGLLDGEPCQGFATLAVGDHEFIPNRPTPAVDFIWKQAVDRGFFPQHTERAKVRALHRHST